MLQTSGCGEAEVVIFIVDKYHCIMFDGRAAFVVQENVWSLFETTSSGCLSVGVDKSVTDVMTLELKRNDKHFNIVYFTWFLYWVFV